MSDTRTAHTWVAMGPAGAVGAVLKEDAGFRVRLIREDWRPHLYPSVEVAKNALVAALPTGSGRPEFIEH
ncbi:methyltransferase [Galbitalea sp. SE-J8]|uniref:methyltransferase n=1 Tax=Galbitalea sp. SE-J8 TaxID=3054952 RepID=UPI00259D1C17|nr:methyltransferase [Galbitalea sp. SE-J8]MDM4764352.1 methyltransferase [Galbitalea sp. SE-J8]